MYGVNYMILKILKNKKIIIILLLLILIGSSCFGILWQQKKMQLVDKGLANPQFPYHEYSIEELWEQGRWPEIIQEDIPTRTAPEQTYAKFRKALIDKDIKKAAECFLPWKQEEIEKRFEQVKEQKLIEQMLKDLPEEISDINISGNSASYEYTIFRNNKRYVEIISFAKDLNGDWRIKTL